MSLKEMLALLGSTSSASILVLIFYSCEGLTGGLTTVTSDNSQRL